MANFDSFLEAKYKERTPIKHVSQWRRILQKSRLYFVIVLVGIDATCLHFNHWRILEDLKYELFYLEQCHRNPDTLKGSGAMLNQSRTVESSDHREKPFPPLRQTMTFLPILFIYISLVRTTLRFFFTKWFGNEKG